MGYIYKITNQVDNKIYVGQTRKINPRERFNQHCYLANHPEQEKGIGYLHRAMQSYGIDNFIFETIEEVSDDLLNEREIYWIQILNSYAPQGYNLTLGGDGTKGFSRPQTDEEKEKRKQSNKQYYIDHPEAVEEQRRHTLKLWEDEEYRRKVTESNIKFYKEHPDMFKGENNPMFGKKHTEEALEKIRNHAATRKLKIAQLDKDTYEELQVFNGVKDAEKALGVSHGWLSKAAKQDKVAYGYRWKFI